MKFVINSLILAIAVVILTGCAEVGPQEGGVRTSMVGFSKGFGEGEWFKKGIKSKPLQPGLYRIFPILPKSGNIL